MKKIQMIISIVLIIGCSSRKIVINEVLTYHELTKEQRKVSGKVVKERYNVNKKTKLKHGIYKRYDLNFRTLEEGHYENGMKSGIWKFWQKDDKIFIEKNYDNNGMETPLINKSFLRYPMVLVEERDSLPEGFLRMKLLFNDKCKLTSLEVVEGIDEEFNTKIANEYKRYAILCYKYEIPIEECVEKKNSLLIHFSNN